MSALITAEVNYYMKIAIDINEKVEGTRASEAETNTRDRFLVTKDSINKNFYYVRTKLEEREKKRGDTQQINADVLEKIGEIYNQLKRMRQTVYNEKGTSAAAQTVKFDVIEKLTAQTRQLQDLIDSSAELEKKIVNNETYTAQRERLPEGGGSKTGRFSPSPATMPAPPRRRVLRWRSGRSGTRRSSTTWGT